MKFIKEHFGFILTIFTTYVIGIFLTIMQYLVLDGDKHFMKTLLNSLIPTTITYVFGCVLVNVSELNGYTNEDGCVLNLIGCFLTFLYAIIFCVYLISGFSWVWMVVELILTALLLWLNVLCYKEKYVNRNHSLTR